MKKLLALIAASLFCGLLSAQSLTITGNIVISDNSPEGSQLIVLKNGKRIDEQTLGKKGNFNVKLALGADYKLSFRKTGYISKLVIVNTEVPEEVVESNPNFPPVKLLINLLPAVSGVNTSIFDQAIAILSYNYELNDFTFDKEYSDGIKEKIAQTEQAVKRAIASQSKAALEQERQYASLCSKAQQAFDRREWSAAIAFWQRALEMKPEQEVLQEKIANAEKAAAEEAEHRRLELQNERAYKALIATADSLFRLHEYEPARHAYAEAGKLKTEESYPPAKIKEIDARLQALAKEQADAEKRLAAAEAEYRKVMLAADQAYEKQAYEDALRAYRQASSLKPEEPRPAEMIRKTEVAIAARQQLAAEEAERRRLEAEKRKALHGKYDQLIAEADAAMKAQNYSVARQRYTDADQLELGEAYPKKQIAAINDILNSSKYKALLAQYNQQKTLGEKNLADRNYAAAKVYYQKALDILPVDKEEITGKLAEIDRLIEAERLAAIEKEYKAHIEKADKAFKEKAYAVAKFYYQKALETKAGDPYATKQLKALEKYIGERQEKEAEL